MKCDSYISCLPDKLNTFFSKMAKVECLLLLSFLFLTVRAKFEDENHFKKPVTCLDRKGNEITTCNKCLWLPDCQWCSHADKGKYV